MKTTTKMVKTMLMSILTAGTLAFGFTACSDELNNEVAGEFSPLEISSGCGLENLEQHSYAVPYMVTAQGDWKIDFKWNEGHQICYPKVMEDLTAMVVSRFPTRVTASMAWAMAEDEGWWRCQVLRL